MKGVTVPRVRALSATMENSLVNLSSTEQTLEAVLQTFTDTNFVLTPNGEILDYRSNAPFLRSLFPGSLRNKRITDVFPANLAEQFEQALRSVQQTGTVIPLEYVLPVGNREYWFEARLIP